MIDLDLVQHLLQQESCGTYDGADFVRLDAIYRIPHDGSAAAFYALAHLWEQSSAGRAIGRERYISQLEAALAARDARIDALLRQLDAGTRVPAAVAAAATGMAPEAEPAALEPEPAAVDAAPPPAGRACPVAGCAYHATGRQALSTHVWRAHSMSLAQLERALGLPPEPKPEPMACPICAELFARGRRALSSHMLRAHRITLPEYEAHQAGGERAPQDVEAPRRRPHHATPAAPAPAPIVAPALADAPAPAWRCAQCRRDAYAPSVSDPDICIKCHDREKAEKAAPEKATITWAA